MADILSPAVVTTEKDLSYVAPNISTSIAAIIGAAKKGPVNSPQYVTTPAQHIDKFGDPVIEGFGGHAALLYLQQANMLWYSRVASRKGSDPIATANTDTRAALAQTDATAFVVPSDLNRLSGKELRLKFDGDSSKDITIQFTGPVIASLIRATIDDTMTAFVNFVNNKLSGNDTFEPRYGYAEVTAAAPTGKKIRVNTQSKDGPLSFVSVMIPTGTDAAPEFGWTAGVTEARGAKTILVATSMEPAMIESAAVGGGGTFDLGTPADATSGNAETYNLGDVAVAGLLDSPSGMGAAYSFVFGMNTADLNTLNGPSSVILVEYQATYAFDPTISLIVDGYVVAPVLPILAITPGAATAADLQVIADAINAACPAGLGEIAHVRNTGNPATTFLSMSTRGKSTGFSYMSLGTPADTPQNNVAASVLAGMWLRFLTIPDLVAKNQNVINVDRDGTVIPLSFDYATLAAQGYRPECLTGAQFATVANGQAGFDLVTNLAGLLETFESGKPGNEGYCEVTGYNNYEVSTGASWLITDPAGNVVNSLALAPAMRGKATSIDGVREVGDPPQSGNSATAYVVFNLAGGEWAVVKIESLQTSGVPWDAQGLSLSYLSGSMDVTNIQKAAFIAALQAPGVLWHCVTATRGAPMVIATTRNDWFPAPPSAGDDVSWIGGSGYVVGEIDRDATCGVQFGSDPNPFGGAGTTNYRRQIEIHVTSGIAPVAGSALTATLGANAGTARAVFQNCDLQLYFHNHTPVQLAGVDVTGIGDVTVTGVLGSLDGEFDVASNLVIDDDGMGTYDIITPSEARFAAPAPNTLQLDMLTSQVEREVFMLVRFTDGVDNRHGWFAVIPSGGAFGTDSFPSSTFNGPSVAGYPTVDLEVFGQVDGHDVLVDTGGPTASYGCVIHQDGIAPGNVQDTDLVLALRNVRIDGMPGWYPDRVIWSFVVAGQTLGIVNAAAPSEQEGSISPMPAYVYNPLTATYTVAEFTGLATYDYGEGFNNLALLVDGTWSVAIDFNNYPFAVRTAATASEVADAINSKARAVDPSLDGIASVSAASVLLTSRTKGSTSSLRAVVDNAALDFSAIATAVTGTGSPTFAASIDGGSEVDVDFGDYVGDLISDQGAATPDEVVAALKRAFNVGDSQCYVSGSGASRKVVVEGTLEGSRGEIEVTSENTALGGDFGVAGTYNGTETTVAASTFYGISPGTWANSDEDHVKIRFTDEDPVFFAPNTSRVDIIVNDSIEETYREVSPNPSADGKSGPTGQGYFLETIIGNAASVGNGRNPSGFVYTNYDEDSSTPGKEYTGGKFVETAVGEEYELSGGADGIDALDEYDYIGVAYDSHYGGPTGLKVWEDIDARFINIMLTPGITYPSVINEMLRICEARADCMCIVDPPIGLTPQQLVDWHNGRGYGNSAAFNSSWGALYNTWVLYADPYNRVDVWLPPSCFVVAVYAYSDKVSEPWFAPAGLVRGKVQGALDLMYTPNLGERNLMYGQGNAINSIVNFSRDGIVVWGQRTLQRLASTLDRVNVRRLVCYLRTISALSTRVYLFDPNDPISRKRIVQTLEEIANDVIRRRGLQRAKVVDKTTTNDINQKRMKIAFFIEPTQAGEILEIPFVLAGAGQAFVDAAA